MSCLKQAQLRTESRPDKQAGRRTRALLFKQGYILPRTTRHGESQSLACHLSAAGVHLE